MLYFELEPVLLHNRCQKPSFLGEKIFNFTQNYINTGFETHETCSCRPGFSSMGRNDKRMLFF